MTTQVHGDIYRQPSSLYQFWKRLFPNELKLNSTTQVRDQEKEFVRATLIKLCQSFLLGDRLTTEISLGYDVVETGLIIFTAKGDIWCVQMTEPIALMAGFNYFSSLNKESLVYLINTYVLKCVRDLNLTLQETGNIIGSVIALRSFQSWWTEPEAQKCLPDRLKQLRLDIPQTVRDCRFKRVSENHIIIDQFRYHGFSSIILPVTHPLDVLCCSIKTTCSCTSNIVYVDVKIACDISFPASEKILGRNPFLQIRLALTHTMPSLAKDFVNNNDDVLDLDLDSELAKVILGQDVIDELCRCARS